ncbi:MAG TPA: response regulator [Ktedonobacterales bacterium]|nr:response regulator [Ktedonobacterales bacterium]
MAEVGAIEVATPTAPPPTVLVIEDDAAVARMLAETLEVEGYTPLVARTGEEGVALATREVPQLILLDLMLPGIDGFETLDAIRGTARTAHIPVLVVSARHDTDVVLRAFGSRVDDYIKKPFDGAELMARVGAQLRRAHESQLSALTNLPGGLRVERAIEDRLASGKRWSILYLDLDTFKAYNDVYGFLRGNDLIRLLARIASESARELGGPDDFVGHVGGDDFIIITTPERVAPLCQRIIERWGRESRALYSPEDLARGGMVALDRRGQRQSYPLVSLSIGVVTNERRAITSPAEVSHIAAEVKRVAKGMLGNAWYIDQRGSGG